VGLGSQVFWFQVGSRESSVLFHKLRVSLSSVGFFWIVESVGSGRKSGVHFFCC
jgi:hypothetical protein